MEKSCLVLKAIDVKFSNNDILELKNRYQNLIEQGVNVFFLECDDFVSKTILMAIDNKVKITEYSVLPNNFISRDHYRIINKYNCKNIILLGFSQNCCLIIESKNVYEYCVKKNCEIKFY